MAVKLRTVRSERIFTQEVFVAEPKLEYWLFVKCKSPDCDCRILLDKIGDVQRCRFPFEALPVNALRTDWQEMCPECSARHTYAERDVLFSDPIDVNQIPAGPPSSAFRQACNHEI